MLSKNMIFRNTLFGAAVCLAGVLTACAEKELNVENPVVEEGQVEICFAPTVGADISTKGSDIQPIGETGLYLRTIVSENKANPFDEVATRATLVDGFSPDGEEGTYSTFKVYSFLHNGVWAENCDNATPYINGVDVISLGNGYWGFEESVFWPSWETNMTFLAYAPVDGGVDISFTEEDAQTGESVYVSPTLVYSDPAVINDESHHGTITDENLAKQYDLLVAQTTDVTKETTTIPMNFSHVFAAVQFICGNMTGGKISKLSLVNIAHEGVYDFGTGTWEVDTDDRTEYVFPLEVTVPGLEEGGSPTIDDNGNEVYPSYDTPIMSGSSTLMMVPQDLTGSALMLEYTPDGEGEEMMELAIELSGSWEAGAHITYHISFLAGNDDILPYLTGTDGVFAAYALANFDTDKDGHVSQAEADEVTEIICGYYSSLDQTPSSRIDFAGIEHFTKLERFTSNYASALDLSQNLELNYIKFNSEDSHAPNVSNLDLSKNTKLTKIPDNAFRSNTNLRTVTLPDTVEEIGWAAFNGVTGSAVSNGFNGLTLPSSLKKIDGHAFYGCTYITAMSIPESVTEMGSAVFYNCTNLASDIKLTNVTEIQDSTFYNCNKVTGITLSENLTKVGKKAFTSCSSLLGDTDNATTAKLDLSNVTEIGASAFRGCTKLVAITLSEGLASVADSTFMNCSTAVFNVPEKFVAGDGITESRVGMRAFYNCTGLTTFPLSDSVTEIDNYAFDGCTALTDITKIPGKLETLGEYAFRNCKALTTDLVIPETITEIPQYAFYYCASKFVDLPSTMTEVGNYAFQHCPAIETFICRAATPPSTGNSYSLSFDASPLPVLYVYADYVSAYTSATYWGNSSARFSTIRTIEEYDNPVEPTGNYASYVGEGITIGGRTYSEATDGPATWITSSDFSFGSSTEGIYFVNSDVELKLNDNANVNRFILIGNDPEKQTTVTMTRTLNVSPYYTDADIEIVFYNIDLDAYTNASSSTMSGLLVTVNSEGEVSYLAFVNCHVKEGSGYGIINFNSYSGGYFSEALISNCVWALGSSATSLFRLNDSCTGTIKSLTMTNNIFYDYSTSVETDFRVLRGAGATLTNLVYENNTTVNLGSSTTSATYGVFEYGSAGEASVTKNLTYVANNNNYVFFHSSALPTTSTGVTDNIAYLYSGSGSTYGSWYWLYDGTDLSNPEAVENACTVLTESPFDALDVSSETFTVNSEYSGYGYQATTGTTEP